MKKLIFDLNRNIITSCILNNSKSILKPNYFKTTNTNIISQYNIFNPIKNFARNIKSKTENENNVTNSNYESKSKNELKRDNINKINNHLEKESLNINNSKYKPVNNKENIDLNSLISKSNQAESTVFELYLFSKSYFLLLPLIVGFISSIA